MGALRIQGVVRLAQRVRRELVQPMTVAHQAELRQLVADSLAQVQRILATHGTTIKGLPAPTRRAYEFLVRLKLDAATPTATSTTGIGQRGDVALVGLKAFWDRVLDGLARATAPTACDALHRSIVSTSANVERHLLADGLQGDHLTATSRTVRSWLAYFSQRENFDAYLAAVARARPILEAALGQRIRFRPPAIVHFRALPGLYRLRGQADATRVCLATPMITFSAELFGTLADAIFGGGSRQCVVEAVVGEDYQTVQAELDALGGLAEHTAGLHHDLADTFARVNGRYFDHALARPRLTWSRTFTGRKFGHYDPVRDTVMISCSLDRADVPTSALDFVVYHELLHKQLGVDWRNGRAAAHTPEFRAAERHFERYPEAEDVLKRLATGH
jgi:hypothetical protein